MRFTVKSERPGTVKTGCVVLGVFEKRRLSDAAVEFDTATEGLLSDLLKRGDMDGSCGQTVLVHFPRGAGSERVLLVGCGKQADFNDQRYREVVLNSVKALQDSGAKAAATYLAELDLKDRDVYWKVRQLVESTCHATFTTG